jgi:hypothetical protein
MTAVAGCTPNRAEPLHFWVRENDTMDDRPHFLLKSYVEHASKAEIGKFIPDLLRGIYVLFKYSDEEKMNVVYIGRSAIGRTKGIGARLREHEKKKDWSHFSAFEVWDNVPDSVVRELETLILLIYARDGSANKLNIQRKSKLFRNIIRKDRDSWKYRS